MGHQYPPPHGPYRQPYQPQPQVVIQRGIGTGWNVFHGIMTVISCGFWSPIWIIHWLVGRGKTKVMYR